MKILEVGSEDGCECRMFEMLFNGDEEIIKDFEDLPMGLYEINNKNEIRPRGMTSVSTGYIGVVIYKRSITHEGFEYACEFVDFRSKGIYNLDLNKEN